jgi:hypothetical protein
VGARKLEVVIPSRIWELLEKCEQKSGVRKEDLIMRSLTKVIEEFGVS